MRQKIEKDLLQARKDKNELKKNLLGVIIGEIQTEELRGHENVDIENILRKMEKSLKTIGTRESEQELLIVQSYLPKLMTGKEIGSIIYDYTQEGLKTIPELMGRFNKDHKGKADNKLVMEIIKENI